jgi:hypothetical protein
MSAHPFAMLPAVAGVSDPGYSLGFLNDSRVIAN